jgi:hypothetical protein
VAHDHTTGRAHLAAPVLGLGLAASLVAELLLPGWLGLTLSGELWPVADDTPADRLLADIYALMRKRSGEDLSNWLPFLAAEAADDVGGRLVAAGVAARRRGGLLGRQLAHLPLNANEAAWPGIRLARQMTNWEPMSWPDATLAALADVTGLMGQVLWDPDVRDRGEAYLASLRESLLPSLSVLVSRTKVAVGEVVLTKRG